MLRMNVVDTVFRALELGRLASGPETRPEDAGRVRGRSSLSSPAESEKQGLAS